MVRSVFLVLVLALWSCGTDGSGVSAGDAPDDVTGLDASAPDGHGAELPGDGAGVDNRPEVSCKNSFDCDDENPCTSEYCDAGKCVQSFNDGLACDDGDSCTTADACKAGLCAGSASVCDDGVDCTTDSCTAGSCTHKVVDSPDCKLSLEIETPLRAATVVGNPFVTVKGKVASPAGKVELLTLNGLPMAKSGDGVNGPGAVTFEQSITAAPGVNVVDVQVKDEHGRTAGRTQAFLYAESLFPAGNGTSVSLVPGAAQAFLRSDVWDDDDVGDLDDMATAIFQVVNGLDVAALIPSPLFAENEKPSWGWCKWQVWVQDVTYDLESVDLDPKAGALSLGAKLTGFAAWVETKADFCPDAIGWVYADAILLQATLPVSVEAGNIVLSVEYVNVDITGVHVDFESGTAAMFDGLINWFDEKLAEKIAQKLEEFLPQQLVPMLEGVLEGFFDKTQQFEIPAVPGAGAAMVVSLKTEPTTVVFSDKGSEFGLDVGVATPHAIQHDAAGSLRRGTCMGDSPDEFSLPDLEPAEVAVSEDLVNQILFSAWNGGQMNVTIPQELLGTAPSALGVKELVVTLDPYLPPVYTSCTKSGAGEIQMGDLQVKATFTMAGKPGEVVLFVSMKVEAEVVVDADYPLNKLGLEVGSATAMGVEVVSSTGAFEGKEDFVEQLLTELAANVIFKEFLNKVVAAYPIPAVDLGELVPGVAPGTALSFQPLWAEIQDGFILLTGYPK